MVEETIRRTSVVSQKSGISTITGKRKTAMKGKDRLDLSNKPSIPFSKDKPDGMTAKGPRRGGLMVDEKMETKAVSNKVYIYYTKAVGINVVIVTLVCAVLNQVCTLYKQAKILTRSFPHNLVLLGLLCWYKCLAVSLVR